MARKVVAAPARAKQEPVEVEVEPVGDDGALDRARAAIARGAFEEAMAELLARWAIEPARELGDAIDQLDAHAPPAVPSEATDKEFHNRAWLAALADAGTPWARGAMIRSIAGRSQPATTRCLGDVIAEWRDPRTFAVIRELLVTLPWIGRRSGDTWQAVFALLGRLGDPRVRDLVATLPATWKIGGPMQRLLTKALRACADAAPVVEPRPEWTGLAIPKPAAADAPAPGRARATSEPELLAAIYANPEDDAPRIVYADWLQEQGAGEVARGELIALQLAGGDPKRERALLKAHGKAWLGPLAKALAVDVEWRRGFPAKGTLQLRNQRDAELHGKNPALATFEELEWSISGRVRDDQHEWAGFADAGALRGLRTAIRPRLRWILGREVVAAAAAGRRRAPAIAPIAPVPWRALERLGLDASELDANVLAEVLAARGVLPKLRALWLVGWGPRPDWLDSAVNRWMPPQLEVNCSVDDGDGETWLRTVAGVPAIQTFVFHTYPRMRFSFVRDGKGRFTTLAAELDLHGTERSPDAIARAAAGFRERIEPLRAMYGLGTVLAHAIDARGITRTSVY